MTLELKQNAPFITWDPEEVQFRVTLQGVKFEEVEEGQTIITSRPSCMYSARVRKSDEDVWTPWFVSPLPRIGVLIDGVLDHVLEMRRVDREGIPIPDEPSKFFKLQDGKIEEETT